MLSAPCTPRFWPYLTIDWLGTVPLMNKVGGKLTNYQSGSAFFTIKTDFQRTDISLFTSYLQFIASPSSFMLKQCNRDDYG